MTPSMVLCLTPAAVPGDMGRRPWMTVLLILSVLVALRASPKIGRSEIRLHLIQLYLPGPCLLRLYLSSLCLLI